jgi:hypothetical protein
MFGLTCRTLRLARPPAELVTDKPAMLEINSQIRVFLTDDQVLGLKLLCESLLESGVVR